MKLYRPVGLKELELILTENAYPPRLDWQPIFYPVLNFEYAEQIATQWNLDDEFSGYAGFVTEFEIDDSYVSQFEVQNVGGFLHNELWIPAEELATFNTHIQGFIQLSGAFYGEKYIGKIEHTKSFTDLNSQEQFTFIENWIAQGKDLAILIENDSIAIQINFTRWQNNASNPSILKQIQETWQQLLPERLLGNEN
ncbi:hypothetical protein BKI52_07570 [marine bacterium AO1-C]|nr:hypothetical protein BKI52_07570 [marine bacterium AO1-C]